MTRNLRDFQAADLASYSIVAISPDDFALSLYREAPIDMVSVLQRHRIQLRSPVRTPEQYLDDLSRNHLLQTSTALRRHIEDL